MSAARILKWIVAIHAMFLGTNAAFSQTYPNKPIRIVTAAPGGGNDIAARIIAQGISGPLGQPVIVDNRPSLIASEIVAHAQPDGYTLSVVGNLLWTGPITQNKPYDPLKDFSPITIVATRPFLLVANASLPVNSIAELITYAKAKPGELNIARSTFGSDEHLAAELLKSMAGINMLIVPYSGSGPAIIALISGQVHLSFGGLAVVEPHVKSGKLKALAVTGAQPSALSPGLPTIAATLPGFEISGITGVYAPVKTPAAVINRLNREIVLYVRSPDGTDKFHLKGDDIVGSTPQELTNKIKTEMVKYTKLIKDAGIRAE